MSSASRLPLSGSTDGKAIKIAQNATPGTLLHTAVTGTTLWDEVWIWVYCSYTQDVILTIEFGGATAPDQNLKFNLTRKVGSQLVVPGLILQNGATVRAFTDAANTVTAMGFVNQITN